jgi:23S rRNA (adenine2503-C2)-methyltransferase
MSLRHVSLSTCGLVDKIYSLAEYKFGLTLSISLHAVTDSKRSQIMPVNNNIILVSFFRPAGIIF